MKFERTEIKTGGFVLVTMGLLLGIILALSAPGLFQRLKTYQIFFDNAGGIRPGAAVYLAGRKVGQVTQIESPIAKRLRPTRFPDYEALVSVRIQANSRIYRDATARMQSNGLLGELVIDFVQGNEESGLAETGVSFTGERAPDFSSAAAKLVKVLEPVASQAEEALKGLRNAATQLSSFFGNGSELQASMAGRPPRSRKPQQPHRRGRLAEPDLRQRARTDPEALRRRRPPDERAVRGPKKLAEQINRKGSVERVLENLRAVSARLDRTIAGLDPQVRQILGNVNQLTDTLKRQPWRVIWPTTKKYPEEASPSAASPACTRAKEVSGEGMKKWRLRSAWPAKKSAGGP